MGTWFVILIILWLPALLYLCWYLIIIILILLTTIFKKIELLLNWIINKIVMGHNWLMHHIGSHLLHEFWATLYTNDVS